MKLNWKFQGVGGSKPKNLPWGNNMNPRFQVWSHWKCSPSSCMFFFFIIPGKRNVKSTSSDAKISGSDICVHKQKINFEKNGKLNKIVVSNWLFNSTEEAGFHSQNATFIKKSFVKFTIQDSIWSLKTRQCNQITFRAKFA